MLIGDIFIEEIIRAIQSLKIIFYKDYNLLIYFKFIITLFSTIEKVESSSSESFSSSEDNLSDIKKISRRSFNNKSGFQINSLVYYTTLNYQNRSVIRTLMLLLLVLPDRFSTLADLQLYLTCPVPLLTLISEKHRYFPERSISIQVDLYYDLVFLQIQLRKSQKYRRSQYSQS